MMVDINEKKNIFLWQFTFAINKNDRAIAGYSDQDF